MLSVTKNAPSAFSKLNYEVCFEGTKATDNIVRIQYPKCFGNYVMTSTVAGTLKSYVAEEPDADGLVVYTAADVATETTVIGRTVTLTLTEADAVMSLERYCVTLDGVIYPPYANGNDHVLTVSTGLVTGMTTRSFYGLTQYKLEEPAMGTSTKTSWNPVSVFGGDIMMESWKTYACFSS